MEHLLEDALLFVLGVGATLGYLYWNLSRARRQMGKGTGFRPLEGIHTLGDDQGSGNVSCVILRYNPYFSAYCVNTATGASWYVPR